MKFALFLLHSRSCLHSVIKHSHQVTRLRCVRLLSIKREQVFSDILEVVLQDLSPLVPQAQLLHVLGGELGQVNRPIPHRLLHCIHQLFFLCLICGWNRFQVCLKILFVVEQQVRELLQGQVRVGISLNGAGMQCSRLIQGRGQSNLIQTMEEVFNADSALGTTVPLRENAVKISSRGVLASKSSPDIHDSLLIDSFLESQWLVCSLLLPALDSFLETLSWAVSNILRKTTALIRVSKDVSLIGLGRQLSGGVRVISSEDLISPFGLLKILSLFVCD